MPSISSVTANLAKVYKHGKSLSSDAVIKVVKKTPVVENVSSIVKSSPFSINNHISDINARQLYINTTICDNGVRVYKLGGNNDISTVTYFDASGKRILKEIWDKSGKTKLDVIAYDKNGLNPMKLPDMIKRIVNPNVKQANTNLPLEF